MSNATVEEEAACVRVAIAEVLKALDNKSEG